MRIQTPKSVEKLKEKTVYSTSGGILSKWMGDSIKYFIELLIHLDGINYFFLSLFQIFRAFHILNFMVFITHYI